MQHGDGADPAEVADYVAEMAGQLAAMAQAAGFTQTSASLLRAQVSALADRRAAEAADSDVA